MIKMITRQPTLRPIALAALLLTVTRPSPEGLIDFAVGDRVVVILPGGVLPGGFAIGARKTYGHNSAGMICSAKELGTDADFRAFVAHAEDLGLEVGEQGTQPEPVAVHPESGHHAQCRPETLPAAEIEHARDAQGADLRRVGVVERAEVVGTVEVAQGALGRADGAEIGGTREPHSSIVAAVRLAGFTKDEAARYFGQPGSIAVADLD